MSQDNSILKGWIFEENIFAFLTVLSWLAKYPFDEADWNAIKMGLKKTDYESETWYDYKFCGDSDIEFRLAQDVGSSVVFMEIKSEQVVASRLELAMDIFSQFTVGIREEFTN